MDASSAAGNPTSTSAGNPTSTTGIGSSSSGLPGTLCDNLCAKASELMCPNTDQCLTECTTHLTGPCLSEITAYFQCYVDFATSCALPPQCDDELQLVELCESGPCGPQACSGGGSSGGQTFCECSTTCGMSTYLASCQTFGSDGKCTCFINNMVVGECEEQNPTCFVFDGCCSQFF